MKELTTVAMDKDAEQLRSGLFLSMVKAEKRRTRELRRGKARRLGPVEAFTLKVYGYTDGKFGMPREISEGAWSSPFLQKELDAQHEHRERVWGTTQIELKPYHMRVESLLTVIAAQERKLGELQVKIHPVNESACTSRKRGEENLTDAQVGARRQRELDRQNAKVRADCHEIWEHLEAYYEELSILHCYITESENTAKLTCERVMDHTRQRIDAYWRAAMWVHPQAADMPSVPDLPRETEAEAAYMEQHALRNQAVAATLEDYRKKQEALQANEADEEAAA